ncbi:MAG: cupin domain-containing protein [Candidatus Helarchaeota archaeon]
MKLRLNDVEEVKMIDGIYRKTLVNDKELMLVHFRLIKDTILPLHSHPHVQAGYVVSGKLEFWEADEKYILEKGDSYIVNANIEHGAKIIEDAIVIDSFSPRREDYL